MFTTETIAAALEPAEWTDENVDQMFGAAKDQVKSRKPLPYSATPPFPTATDEPSAQQPVLALFCYERADSDIGRHVSGLAAALAKRQRTIHLFVRAGFEVADVSVHPLAASQEGDLIHQVEEFGRRAVNEFLELFQASSAPITLLGFEWSSLPILTTLQAIKNLKMLWSVHSLERQRSGMTADLSKRIEEIELTGLQVAKSILVHDPATAKVASLWVPECADRIADARQVFRIAPLTTPVDPGQIKARYQVGPVDPTILFIGDLSERYGPDLLVKAMPAILKNHPQARLILVGAGNLYWPLRVYTRYLLLEHAVRLVGSVEGQALHELIQAADIIAVPSRDTTPWWPFLAGWAAQRPVVGTHAAAPGILTHEQDSILCYPSENSCVWGIERILFNAELGRMLARQGHEKLQERFGWHNAAAQVEDLLGAAALLS